MSTQSTFDRDDLDHFLVARVLARQDSAAFGELIRRHQSRVRLFLRRLCRDDALADDLAQDTFVHAWDKLGGYRGHGSFVGWLLKIAWTQFLQSRRQRERYREVLQDVESAVTTTPAVGQADDLADLDALLAVLTDEERAIMILSYACGLSHREIGDATGMPVGTIKSIIHRGKLKIRSRFDIKVHQYA